MTKLLSFRGTFPFGRNDIPIFDDFKIDFPIFDLQMLKNDIPILNDFLGYSEKLFRKSQNWKSKFQFEA